MYLQQKWTKKNEWLTDESDGKRPQKLRIYSNEYTTLQKYKQMQAGRSLIEKCDAMK